MKNKIEIYQTNDHQTQVQVSFDQETVWLNRQQLAELFDRDIKTIGKHVNNVFKEQELDKASVVAFFAITASDGKTYQVEHYNLDVIISVGYRVKSQRGTQFRQWATQRLKDYLVDGYAINEARLAEKNQEIQYLKTGFQILTSTVKDHIQTDNDTLGLTELMTHFSKGLTLLDDYDHEKLDQTGQHKITQDPVTSVDLYPVIDAMKSDFSSPLFGLERGGGFQSAVAQIYQSFGDAELYPTLEEKAAVLLYLVVKNHAFMDGNKRIGAACFIYFLNQHQIDIRTRISSEGLATLTLFVATSQADDMKTVIRLIVSILNRGTSHG
jgi:prophage maintenance system killer protein